MNDLNALTKTARVIGLGMMLTASIAVADEPKESDWVLDTSEPAFLTCQANMKKSGVKVIPDMSFYFGGNIMQVNYTQGGVDISEKSFNSLYGVRGQMLFKTGGGTIIGNSNYIEFYGRYSAGETTHDSLGLAGHPIIGGARSDVDNEVFDLRLGFYDYDYNRDYRAFLMAGVGYREWERDYTDLSFTEKVMHPYAEIGFGYSASVFESTWIGIEGYGGLAPLGKSKLIVPGAFNETLDLGMGYFASVVVPFSWPISKVVSLNLRPTVEFTHSGESNQISGIYSPETETITYDIEFGVRFDIF